MTENYIREVLRRVPEKRHEEIRQELERLIEEKMQARCADGARTEQDMEAVLTELGNPVEMARKLTGREKHLIGGQYYEPYLLVMKIALICTAIGLVISWFISTVVEFVSMDSGANLNTLFKVSEDGFDLLVAIPSTLLSVFGCITLIFALIEYFQVKIDGYKDETKQAWTPAQMKQAVPKHKKISRGDCIAGIVFSMIFLLLFCCFPEYLGVWMPVEGSGVTVVSLFNLQIWNSLLPLFLIGITAGIIEEIVKLCVGRYTIGVTLTVAVTQAVSLITTIFIFLGNEAFNPRFKEQIEAVTDLQFQSNLDLLNQFNTGLVSRIIVVIALVCTVLEIGKAIIRTARSNENGR